MPEYVRVTDQDTGHKFSIQRSALAHGNTVLKSEVAHGNYRELKADALDHNGDPLPPEFNAVKPLSSSTPEAKPAIDTTKE
jgi:hypothetical protein